MSGPYETNCGNCSWYDEDSKPHRPDGPAFEGANGYHAWYQHGELHRLDGPAILHKDGYCEWWVNGVRLPDNSTQEDILGALL